jgi:hypothetical protein
MRAWLINIIEEEKIRINFRKFKTKEFFYLLFRLNFKSRQNVNYIVHLKSFWKIDVSFNCFNRNN